MNVIGWRDRDGHRKTRTRLGSILTARRTHVRMLAVSALAASLVLANTGPAWAACAATHPLNSTECTTYWNAYRVSDLTTAIQLIILYDGYSDTASPGSLDGDYGPNISSNTAQAVVDYQGHFNLTQDGITGGNTWTKLDVPLDYDGAYTSTFIYEGLPGLPSAYPSVLVPSTGGYDRVAYRYYYQTTDIVQIWCTRCSPDAWVTVDSTRA